MTVKGLLRNPWLYFCAALLIGLLAGSLVTQWRYSKLYSSSCGSVSYYDKTGKTKLYTDDSCAQ